MTSRKKKISKQALLETVEQSFLFSWIRVAPPAFVALNICFFLFSRNRLLMKLSLPLLRFTNFVKIRGYCEALQHLRITPTVYWWKIQFFTNKSWTNYCIMQTINLLGWWTLACNFKHFHFARVLRQRTQHTGEMKCYKWIGLERLPQTYTSFTWSLVVLSPMAHTKFFADTSRVTWWG